jgi:hypothetical protein
MISDVHTVITEAGLVSVRQTSPDHFRLTMEDAHPPGGRTRYTVRAELFMPEPGQFVDFDPDGEDAVAVLPKGAGHTFDDVALIAADIESGMLVVEQAIAIAPNDEGLLRDAIATAASRVFDLSADIAERSVMEAAITDEIEDAPAPRM